MTEVKGGLFDLASETVEIIFDHLSLGDLINVSQTCGALDKLTWSHREQISKIILAGILSEKDFDTFNNSKKKYFQNVHFWRSNLTHASVQKILRQVSSLSSVQLTNIEITDTLLSSTADLFQAFKDDIATITLRVISQTRFRIIPRVIEIKTKFPKTKIIVKIPFFKFFSRLDLNRFNVDCFYPIEISLKKVNVDFKIHQDIYNITKLKLYSFNENLHHFRNLKELQLPVKRRNYDLTQTLIETNRNSLEILKVCVKGLWIYTIPFQLKEIHIHNKNTTDYSTWIIQFLENQEHLRSLMLQNVYLYDLILFTVLQNKFLTSVTLQYCKLAKPTDFMPFDQVQKVKLVKCDVEVLNIVLGSSDNLQSLTIIRTADEITKLRRNSVLNNLEVLKIEGIWLAEYICESIKVPNLEICSAARCATNFFMNCAKLRDLEISEYGVNGYQTPDEVFQIWSHQQLRSFQFSVENRDVDEILTEISRYNGNIKHFVIKINDFNYDELYEFENFFSSPAWRKVDTLHFTCGNFSIKIFLET